MVDKRGISCCCGGGGGGGDADAGSSVLWVFCFLLCSSFSAVKAGSCGLFNPLSFSFMSLGVYRCVFAWI